jgi:uncharacterized protein YcfJ
MRNFILSLSALAVAMPASVIVSSPAAAHHRAYRHYHYAGHVYRTRAAYYRARCRHSPGNAGLIVGGVAGGVVGHNVIGHGLVGVAAGAVGGALAGRAVDRTISAPHRCR